MIFVNKNISKFKNRGLELEKILNNTFNSQANKEICLIEKYPTPIQILESKAEVITKAYFKRSSALDFVGIYKGKHIEIEAKSLQNSTIFNFSLIKDHQIERIKKLIKFESLVYLIIEFKSDNRFFLLKGEKLIDEINQNKKSLKIKDLENIAIELKLLPNLTLNLFSYF